MKAVCTIDELSETAASIIDLGKRQIIALKREGKVYLYHNRCPHMGSLLNSRDSEIMVDNGRYLICTMHFAMFESDTGQCVAGPCPGATLSRISYELNGDNIMINSHI